MSAEIRPGRVLAVDYGLRRCGLAVSDPLGITAQGLETVEVRSRDEAVRRVAEVARDREAAEIVVGHPVNMDGTIGPAGREVEEFARLLAEATGLPVRLYDERMTTMDANRSLREQGLSARKRREKVDRVAAQLILQAFLTSRGGCGLSGTAYPVP